MKVIDYIKEIDKKILNSSNVYIMCHKYIDLDALGAVIGMSEYVRLFDKRSTIILNDVRIESGVKRALLEIKNKYKIVKSAQIRDRINSNDLLIIVDTNKKDLLQDPNIFDRFNSIILIDHHDISKNTIKEGIVIIDEDASSTAEMVGELLKEKKVKLNSIVSNLLLSGIVLDTNNFVLNTSHNTFNICSYLTANNADMNFVQYLLKQNIKKYFRRQAILTNVKVYGNIAITFSKSDQMYRREDLARVADTLIQFNKIEASFVIGKIDKNTIGISARSLGNIQVGKMLEEFNGGGTEHNAGARIEGKTIKEVKLDLLKIIRNVK